MVVLDDGKNYGISIFYPLINFSYSDYVVGLDLTEFSTKWCILLLTDIISAIAILLVDILHANDHISFTVSCAFFLYTTVRIAKFHKICRFDKSPSLKIRPPNFLLFADFILYYSCFVGLYVYNLEDKLWILRPLDYFLMLLFLTIITIAILNTVYFLINARRRH